MVREGVGLTMPEIVAPSLDVSILLTNWNVRDLMKDAILSVYRQTKDITYEVIVVDDGSTDGSVEMLRKDFPDVRLLVNEKNVGFSKANNLGVTIARGKYILLLNTDTLLVNNPVKVLFDFLETHPEAGVCGAWLKGRDMSSQVSYGNFPSFHQAVVDALFLNDLFPRAGLPNIGTYPLESSTKPIEVDYVTGAAILIRKEIIDRIGLFDEWFRAYCEETDFCYRVKHVVNRKVYFVPDAHVIHLVGLSYSKVRKYQLQLMYSSFNKFLTKHHGSVYSFCTRLLYAWRQFLKLLVRYLLYAVAPPAKKELKRNYMLHTWYGVRYSLFPNEQFTGS